MQVSKHIKNNIILRDTAYVPEDVISFTWKSNLNDSITYHCGRLTVLTRIRNWNNIKQNQRRESWEKALQIASCVPHKDCFENRLKIPQAT